MKKKKSLLKFLKENIDNEKRKKLKESIFE